MKTFLRASWVAAVVALGGCTTLLGVEHDYPLMGSTTTPRGRACWWQYGGDNGCRR
jgi:hypothetical protein